MSGVRSLYPAPFITGNQMFPPKPNERIIYDPPSGWMYGFPKEYVPRRGLSLEEILVEDGYPESEAEFAARYTRFWTEKN